MPEIPEIETVADAAPAPKAPDYAKLLNEWINESIHNSPVSRATEAFNHLANVAVPALLAKLTKG